MSYLGGVLLTLVFLLVFAGAAFLVCWALYWGPRARAFRLGQSRVPVWFGIGTLVLWNPGETIVFLRNKRVRDVGDSGGRP